MKKKCLLHANCQGEPLAELLNLVPEFLSSWDLVHYTNYTKEEIPTAVLKKCDLLLYQFMGEEWKELSSAALLATVPAHCQTIRLPNMLFKGYWPFWTLHSSIDFGDTVLNKLIDAGAQKPEILAIYLHRSLEKMVNLEDKLNETLLFEESKEQLVDIKTLPLVRKLWQKEMLFYTPNHPAKTLLVHVANNILQRLNLPVLTAETLDAYEPEYAEFELPIHPQITQKFTLEFINSSEHKFKIFTREMSFEQYISRYIDCRLNKLDDSFVGYLQLV